MPLDSKTALSIYGDIDMQVYSVTTIYLHFIVT